MTASTLLRALCRIALSLSLVVAASGPAVAATGSEPVHTDPTVAGGALAVGLLVLVGGGLYQLVRG